MTRETPRALAAIDLLRFACAMLVVAHHFGAVLPIDPNRAAAGAMTGVALPTTYAPWTASGWIGVELFFLISGYVIACSAQGSVARHFLVRRSQRLLPAACLCGTLTLIALLAVNAETPEHLWGGWLRAVSFWPLGDAIDPSYWTLGIEAAFYLMVAARLRGGNDPARIEALGWTIGLVSLGFWLLLLVTGSLAGSWPGERLAQLLLLPHGCFFAIGMLIRSGHCRGFTRARLIGLALFGGAAAIEILSHATIQARDLRLPVDGLTPMALFAGGALIVAGCVRAQRWIGRGTRFTATVGLMTYPLYLLHQQLGAVVAGQLVPMGVPAEAAFGAALVLALILSWVVVRHGEPPLRRRIGALADALTARRDPRRDSRPSPFP